MDIRILCLHSHKCAPRLLIHYKPSPLIGSLVKTFYRKLADSFLKMFSLLTMHGFPYSPCSSEMQHLTPDIPSTTTTTPPPLLLLLPFCHSCCYHHPLPHSPPTTLPCCCYCPHCCYHPHPTPLPPPAAAAAATTTLKAETRLEGGSANGKDHCRMPHFVIPWQRGKGLPDPKEDPLLELSGPEGS